MKQDITYTIKKWGIDYSDLIPRHTDKYKVMPLNEKEWYFQTEEENQDGYAVYENDTIVYLSSDPYEASNEFDNLVYLQANNK
ncbi:MAG: hypothetical protein WCK82_14790 [Bacteroidota bacterium]|jgi:hypothetical protein